MLNLEEIQNRVITIPIENPLRKPAELKTLLPGIIGAGLITSAAQIITNSTPETVFTVVPKILNYGACSVLVIGVLAYFRHMDQITGSLKEKKIEYLKIQKQDFKIMQEEIIRLRQQVENQK